MYPFDDSKIIAGQGTVGLEILEEVPEVDAVVAGVGGGGLSEDGGAGECGRLCRAAVLLGSALPGVGVR